jgi:hypothetical protein
VAYALANRWHVHGHASCCGRRRAGRPPAPARSRRRVRRPGWRRHRARPSMRSPDEPVPRAPCELAAASDQLGDWAGPVGPTRDHPTRPEVKLERPQAARTLESSLWPTPAAEYERADAGRLRAGWYSRRARASAERGRAQGPGRAEADLGPGPSSSCYSPRNSWRPSRPPSSDFSATLGFPGWVPVGVP